MFLHTSQMERDRQNNKADCCHFVEVQKDFVFQID